MNCVESQSAVSQDACDCSETRQIVSFIAHQLVNVLNRLNLNQCSCGSCSSCHNLLSLSNVFTPQRCGSVIQAPVTAVLSADASECSTSRDDPSESAISVTCDELEEKYVETEGGAHEDYIVEETREEIPYRRIQSAPGNVTLSSPESTNSGGTQVFRPIPALTSNGITCDELRYDCESPNSVIRRAIAGAGKRKMRLPERTDLPEGDNVPSSAGYAIAVAQLGQTGMARGACESRSTVNLPSVSHDRAMEREKNPLYVPFGSCHQDLCYRLEYGGISGALLRLPAKDSTSSPETSPNSSMTVQQTSPSEAQPQPPPPPPQPQPQTQPQSMRMNGTASSHSQKSTSQNNANNAVEELFSQCVIPVTSTRTRKSCGQIKLWQFLLDLLDDCGFQNYIRWVNRDAGEFKLLNADAVARLWGRCKERPHMNYEKMSRILRYYYKKNIMRKVRGHAYVYKFLATDPAILDTWDRSANAVGANATGDSWSASGKRSAPAPETAMDEGAGFHATSTNSTGSLQKLLVDSVWAARTSTNNVVGDRRAGAPIGAGGEIRERSNTIGGFPARLQQTASMNGGGWMAKTGAGALGGSLESIGSSFSSSTDSLHKLFADSVWARGASSSDERLPIAVKSAMAAPEGGLKSFVAKTIHLSSAGTVSGLQRAEDEAKKQEAANVLASISAFKAQAPMGVDQGERMT